MKDHKIFIQNSLEAAWNAGWFKKRFDEAFNESLINPRGPCLRMELDGDDITITPVDIWKKDSDEEEKASEGE